MTTSSIVLTIALLLSTSARADGPFDLAQAAKLKRAQRRTNVGIALTILGSAALATSVTLWVLGSRDTQSLVPSLEIAGAATTSVAGGLLGSGIALWVTGSNQEKRTRAAACAISADGVVHF
jgi:hypothetical protein